MSFRRPIALLLLALTLAFPAIPAAAAGDEGLWREWTAGLAEASTKERPVLVDVYTGWCGWCKKMDRDVYSRADVREYLNKRFVPIKLDAESGKLGAYEGKNLSSRAIAARLKVTGYPTTVFLRPNGERMVNVPGYVDGDKFLTLLRYVGEGHMDRGVSWDAYLEGAGAKPKK